MGDFHYEHPRPALTIDVVMFSIVETTLNVLLIKRLEEPFKDFWALPGGFIEMDESLEEAAHRELKEETGVETVFLEQLYTYGDPDRDPRARVISVAYIACLPKGTSVHPKRGDDAVKADWFPVDDLPSLAFDHEDIVTDALERLREMLKESAIAFELLPEEFTLSEIQNTYEIILGVKLDKRNFRRRILEANILEHTTGMRTGEGRPARLYRYKTGASREIKTRSLFP